MFYETAATIITFVFLGNYLEDTSIASTQRELNKLAKSQKVMANMIAFDDEHKEQIFPRRKYRPEGWRSGIDKKR